MLNKTKEPGWDFCEFLNYDSGSDLVLYEIGTCNCKPGYSYGPSIRQRDIFHFVKSGKGKLRLNDREYFISPGQGFLIPSGSMAYYEADRDEPWSYCWLHIGGLQLPATWTEIGLGIDNPVFIPTEVTNDYLTIYKQLIDGRDRELYSIGKLYELLDYLKRYSSAKNESENNLQLSYIRKIISFIKISYSSPIQLSDMATVCGIDQSYMARLFKSATGTSIHSYLISYRIKIAKQLLLKPELTIQYIALSVGYSDIFSFSKVFKKNTGLSPRQWRAEHLNNNKV